MNIFKCSSKNKFIDEFIDFITENYKDNFPKLKILLPNGLTCSELQQALIKTHGTIILPNSPYAKRLFSRKFASSFIDAIFAATNNLYLIAK